MRFRYRICWGDTAANMQSEQQPKTSWLDPTGLRAAVCLALFAALANGIWILLDHSTPSWDPAHYLDIAWQYKQNLDHQGIVPMLQSIHSLDPSRGPLFTTMLVPFLYLLSDLSRGGMVLNLVLAPILYLSAGQVAMRIFGNWIARLLAILLVATLPLLVGLYHNTLQDFALATFATLAVLLLLESNLFQRRGVTLALGAVMGLGTLTKVTFPVFVAGPFIVIAAQTGVAAWRSRQDKQRIPTFDLRHFSLNLAGMAAVYLVLILPWYVTNFSPTMEYIEETTGGKGLSLGAGPSNPYTFHAISSFTMTVVNGHVSWIIVLSGMVALLLSGRKILGWMRPPRNTARLGDVVFLAGWVLIPYLSLALGHNQDVRLMAPAMPGIAVIVAGAIAAVEKVRVRVALIGVTAVVLVYQTVNLVTPIRPSFVPRDLSLRLGSQEAVIPLDSRPVGYEMAPGADYGTPIIRYIESVARNGAPTDAIPPTSVCLLQANAVANGNTMNFLAHTRGDPFAFTDVFARPEEQAQLFEALSSCRIALYMKEPPLSAAEDTRVGLVNLEYATRFMTPRMRALFRGSSRAFPTTDDPEDPTTIVHVLIRKPEPN